ncbi:MAG TPA: hypothetical protein VFE18_00410, partial [Phenylobacterium sp.]|uniref:hypothetical protein n=1 Tax=Phenylobacterium sp. TaxID=1871053 RepID=UPI002D5DF214
MRSIFGQRLTAGQRASGLTAKRVQLTRAYCTSLGFFTAAWAGLEVGLDRCNEVILSSAGGDQIRADLPVSLLPKLQFFRKAHHTLAPLHAFRAV